MKTADSSQRLARIHQWMLMLAVLTIAVTAQAADAAARPHRQVVVSVPDRKLAVLQDGVVVRIFPVAVGAAISPSPTGSFLIGNRVERPAFYRPGVVIPPGADNPIGPRWIGLNREGYGIHGTNEPHSIGKAASHGCIRMRNRDVEQFYRMVRVGDEVEIRTDRDEQIAQIFGGKTPEMGLQASALTSAVGGQ